MSNIWPKKRSKRNCFVDPTWPPTKNNRSSPVKLSADNKSTFRWNFLATRNVQVRPDNRRETSRCETSSVLGKFARRCEIKQSSIKLNYREALTKELVGMRNYVGTTKIRYATCKLNGMDNGGTAQHEITVSTTSCGVVRRKLSSAWRTVGFCLRFPTPRGYYYYQL